MIRLIESHYQCLSGGGGVCDTSPPATVQRLGRFTALFPFLMNRQSWLARGRVKGNVASEKTFLQCSVALDA